MKVLQMYCPACNALSQMGRCWVVARVGGIHERVGGIHERLASQLQHRGAACACLSLGCL